MQKYVHNIDICLCLALFKTFALEGIHIFRDVDDFSYW